MRRCMRGLGDEEEIDRDYGIIGTRNPSSVTAHEWSIKLAPQSAFGRSAV
jgi:hypothetical protein